MIEIFMIQLNKHKKKKKKSSKVFAEIRKTGMRTHKRREKGFFQNNKNQEKESNYFT